MAINVLAVERVSTVRVKLTLSELKGGEQYTLTVQNVESTDGNTIVPGQNTAVFTGVGINPKLLVAAAQNATTIDCLFDSAMEIDSKLIDPANYVITGPSAITVSNISVTSSQIVSITISTDMIEGGLYTLTVSNVTDEAGNVIDPAYKSALFNGIGRPQVASATSTATDTIRVVFDKAMSDTGLTTNGNYTFTCPAGATITVGSVTKVNSTTVDITSVGEMLTGTNNYTITVANVTDAAGNIINASHDSDTFNGIGVAPQVSSATFSSDTTHIDVVFDEAMANNAALVLKTNYAISGASVPTVDSVSRINATTVRVVTTDVVPTGVHTVTVTPDTGITDLVGNALDSGHKTANFSWTKVSDHPSLPTTLISYYTLESNANDSIGGHNGSLEGPPVNVAGKVGNCYDFDGAAHDIIIAHNAAFDVLQITVAAWVNFDTNNTFKSYVSKNYSDGATTDYVWALGNNSAGLYDPYFYIRDSFNVSHGLASGSTPNTGQWYLIVGTYDGTAVRLYVNGNSIGSDPYVGNLRTNARDIYIARRGGGNVPIGWHNGKIDEVGIWGRALTANEVKNLYNGNNGISY